MIDNQVKTVEQSVIEQIDKLQKENTFWRYISRRVISAYLSMFLAITVYLFNLLSQPGGDFRGFLAFTIVIGNVMGLIFATIVALSDYLPEKLLPNSQQILHRVVSITIGLIGGTLMWVIFVQMLYIWGDYTLGDVYPIALLAGLGISFGIVLSQIRLLPLWLTIVFSSSAIGLPQSIISYLPCRYAELLNSSATCIEANLDQLSLFYFRDMTEAIAMTTLIGIILSIGLHLPRIWARLRPEESKSKRKAISGAPLVFSNEMFDNNEFETLASDIQEAYIQAYEKNRMWRQIVPVVLFAFVGSFLAISSHLHATSALFLWGFDDSLIPIFVNNLGGSAIVGSLFTFAVWSSYVLIRRAIYARFRLFYLILLGAVSGLFCTMIWVCIRLFIYQAPSIDNFLMLLVGGVGLTIGILLAQLRHISILITFTLTSLCIGIPIVVSFVQWCETSLNPDATYCWRKYENFPLLAYESYGQALPLILFVVIMFSIGLYAPRILQMRQQR